MKKILTLLFLTVLASDMLAGPIDKNAAYQIATQFMEERSPSSKLQAMPSYRAPKLAGSNQPDYYVFNADYDEGFVIVSGNDRTSSPILGYSDTGSFDPDNIPEGLKLLLDLYSVQIQALNSQSDDESETSAPMRSLSVARHPVAPLDTFYFHGVEPYNYYSPVDSTGSHFSMGCTTVATAQVLAYWQYPAETPEIKGYSMNDTVIGNIPAKSIDWKNILKTYVFRSNKEMPNAQIDAIADLMYRIAIASKLDFWNNGVSTSIIRSVLINTFGYDSSMKSFDLSGTNNINLAEEIIYNELANKRPVIMYGSRLKTDPSSSAAHMWVVDGYEMDDMFHFNWGWNSNMNGYYMISAIDPYHHELLWNYMLDIGMLYGIKPSGDEGSSALDPDNYSKRLTLTALTASSSGSRNVTVTLKNNLSKSFTFDQGLSIYDSGMNLIETVAGDQVTLDNNETTTAVFSIDYSKYTAGTYYVKPVSKISTDDEWLKDEIMSTYSYLKCVLSAKKLANYSYIRALKFNSLQMEDHGPVVVGAPQYFNMSVTNNTDDKYARYLYLYANDEIVQVRGVHIPANTTATIHFGYEPTVADTIHLVFATAKSLYQQLTTYDLPVEEASYFGDNIKMDVIVDNVDEKVDTMIYGDTFRAKIKVTNTGSKDYHDYLNFIFRYSMQMCTAKPLADIPAGESKTYDFEFKGLKKGATTYRFTTYFKRGSNFTFKESYNQRFRCSSSEGFAYWTADGRVYTQTPKNIDYVIPEEAVAVNFYGNSIQPSSITPNSNPNTLIYVRGNYYAYLNTLNVVRNGNAKNITLQDGYPFYVPKDLTVNNITYTRNFEHGYGDTGINWSTIVLPFVPQTITDASTGREIDWHRTSSEVGKDFWIREFYAEDGNDLYFVDAEEFEPYRPYIIAVPDATFGDDFDLTDRDIVFGASDIQLQASVNAFADAYHYNFVGTLTGRDTEGCYAYLLNEGDGGNRFAYTAETATLDPFRAMFTTSFEPNGTYGPLRILKYTPTPSGIDQATGSMTGQRVMSGVYTIDGRKVMTSNGTPKEILDSLPKGMYIIQGRKYIK